MDANLFTVSGFARKHNFLSESALRNMIVDTKNPLKPVTPMHKALKRIGRRVFIDERIFFAAVKKMNT